MHVFNIAEIFGKEGSDDDDIAVCWNNRAEENIDGGCGTTGEEKSVDNRIKKRRTTKRKCF